MSGAVTATGQLSGSLHRRAILLFQGASFTGSFDRFIVVPLIGMIAMDWSLSLQEVSWLASGYFAAYALMQLFWGMISDRIGRVRSVQIAMGAAGIAGVISAFAPDFGVLLVARILAGASFAAALPTAMIYIGETVAERDRQRPLSALMVGTAVGSAIAVVVGALVSASIGWRSSFAIPALLAIVIALAFFGVPNSAPPQRTPTIRSVVIISRSVWARALLAIGLVEGIVLLGSLTFIPLTFELVGFGATESGVLFGCYGVAVLLSSLAVGRWSSRFSAPVQMSFGAATSFVAFIILISAQDVPRIILSCALLGAGWAVLHTPVQAWATFVAPEARTVAVSLYATALLLGSSLGTALGSEVLATWGAGTMYSIYAVITVILGVLAVVCRRGFDRAMRR